MKKLLLCVLLFAGVAVFAAKSGTHRLYVFTPAKLAVASETELNGGDYKLDGEYAGVRYYFTATKAEGETVSFKITPSADGEITFQISGMKGTPVSEYTSLKVDGKELLDEPLSLTYKSSRPRYVVEGAKGKEMVVSMTIKCPAAK